jgi:hypothetical protein
VTIDTAISGLPTCVRQAWLVLPGGATIQLDNPSAGYMCQSLDLGTPIMRTVMTNRPDQDGIIDRTTYMGARTVTASITALTGAGAQIDAVAASFAPYMVPSQRPVLHYVLDRPGAPERTLTLRPDSYDWPVVGATQRDIALQWVAPSPYARDPTQKTGTTLWSAFTTMPAVGGDVPARPVLTITGPVTKPRISLRTRGAPPTNPTLNQWQLFFLSSVALSAGQTITMDCAAHTIVGPSGSILNQFDWAGSNISSLGWPQCPPSPNWFELYLDGTAGTNGTGTQCVASWYDGYLT